MAENKSKRVFEDNLNEEQLNATISWYNGISQSDAEFAVLVSRRGFVFFQFLEKNLSVIKSNGFGGGEVSHHNPVIISDSSFLTMGEYFADFYMENSRFPKVLIADDTLLHGRNLVSILGEMEKRIKAAIGRLEPRFSSRRIEKDFLDSIRILVIACARERLVMDSKYLSRTEHKLYYTNSDIHEFSVRVSRLIIESDTPNTSYLYSELVSLKEESIYKLKDLKYLEFEEKFWIHPVVRNGVLKFVFAVRLKKLPEKDEKTKKTEKAEKASKTKKSFYLATPYVFIPDLTEDDTVALDGFISSEIWGNDGHEGTLRKIWKDKSCRAYNEVLTIFLGNVVLSHFKGLYCSEEPFSDDAFEKSERRKLVRNYYGFFSDASKLKTSSFMPDDIEEETQRALDAMLSASNECSIDRLENLLVSLVGDGGFGKVDTGSSSSATSKDEIRREIEAFYSDMACEDEVRAFHGLIKARRKRSSQSVISAFLDYFSIDKDNILDLFGYLLFMIDYGVVSLSSNTDGQAEILGFKQLLKAGEMSLSLFSIRARPYLSLVYNLRKECYRRGLLSQYFKRLEEYIRKVDGSKYGKGDWFNEDDKKDIMSFARTIERYGEEADAWWGDFYNKFVDLGRYVSDEEGDDFYRKQRQIAVDCIRDFRN